MPDALAALLVASPESGTTWIHNSRAARPRRSSWRSGCGVHRGAAVTRRDLVDVRRARVRDGLAFDLDHVLGVALTAVREVEAADVDVVVGDEDLRVHEVVHSPDRVGRRALGAEPRRGRDAVERRDLP